MCFLNPPGPPFAPPAAEPFEVPGPIEAYTSDVSVTPGGTLDFHVRTDLEGSFTVRILRNGVPQSGDPVGTGTAGPHDTLPDPWVNGCGWPVAYTFQAPPSQPSGAYVAELTASGSTTRVPFAVRPCVTDARGRQAAALLKLNFNTYQAYNDWGGKSLYPSDQNPPKVTFNRPYRRWVSHQIALWEIPFLIWLESQGLAVDCCTDVDLHRGDPLLDPSAYKLILSVGHDEYWSKEMRDAVEGFVAAGGNAAFFSGNVCWWQTRFEDDARTLVCYKYKNSNERETADPLVGIDNSRVTTHWWNAPVCRPESQMTGVSFLKGAAWAETDPALPRPVVPYIVKAADHPVFYGTGLANGSPFGGEDPANPILGYETDAVYYPEPRDSACGLSADQGTPDNFLVLASADLSGWMCPPEVPPGDCNRKPGMATMGIYQYGGTVFTAATVDWAKGLNDPKVATITRNVLSLLGLDP
ncbi:MAG: hypothetical protein NVSMB9_00990 [Isosphaeraceae bacterium]